MASVRDPQIEHLLRRAGFGARPDELSTYLRLAIRGAVDTLVDYERVPDDVDDKIGRDGFVGTTSRGPFSPATNIVDARQRWLFRMVHSNRPLQEKMTLFWANHFATAYSKIAGLLGATEATRYMAAKPTEDPGGVRGQIELFRENALGNFRDLLVAVAQDVAMLYWLDGRTNTRAQPQENFGREIMELFTMGVGHFTEPDVYAAARVFTGWNARVVGARTASRIEFFYNANQHDLRAKEFSFPINSDGSHTIPARAAADGLQDGLDFIAALASHQETARHLARKLYRWFVTESGEFSEAFVNRIAASYLRNGFQMKAVVRDVLMSPEFWDARVRFTRYSSPVEFVVRAIKDIGWNGFSVNDALGPLSNMGQLLYDPPDVNGWDMGQAWFSTGSMLARMNFAASLASNQQVRLAQAAAPHSVSAEAVLAFVLDSLAAIPFEPAVRDELSNYLVATGPWTGSTSQLRTKVPGLVHLVAASAEYQFV